MGGDAAAAESVGFDPDHLVGWRWGQDLLPGLDRLIAARVGGDGAVEEGQDLGFVELAAGAVERGIAGDDYPGLAWFEMPGELIFVLRDGGHVGKGELVCRAKQNSAGERGLEKIATIFHGNSRFLFRPSRKSKDNFDGREVRPKRFRVSLPRRAPGQARLGQRRAWTHKQRCGPDMDPFGRRHSGRKRCRHRRA